MRRYVVAACVWGLGNRMKALVSAMRVADRCGRELLVYWPRNEHMCCTFSELFAVPLVQIDDDEFSGIVSRSGQVHRCSGYAFEAERNDCTYVVNDSWRHLLFPDERVPAELVWPAPLHLYDGKGADGRFDAVPLAVRSRLVDYFERLTPRRECRERVADFAQQFDAQTISVHVRTWQPAASDDPGRRVFFHPRTLFSTLDRHERGKFFITSDSSAVVESVRARYPGRVLVHPDDRFGESRRSPEGEVSSLVVLRLLARNQRMIASFGSTYSDVAWYLGGCAARVTVLPVTVWERLAYRFPRAIRPLLRLARGDERGLL